MPETYINAFVNAYGGPVVAWRWSDGDADAQLIAATTAVNWSTEQNLTIHRSGPQSALSWDVYEYFYGWSEANVWLNGFYPTGDTRSLPLIEGQIVVWNKSGGGPPVENGIGTLDVSLPGWWESDGYGRPFTLNDLLAE